MEIVDLFWLLSIELKCSTQHFTL